MEDMVEVGSMLNKMPELPEVETIKNILSKKIIGKKIVSVDIYREKTILNNIEFFTKKVEGATITGLSRIGKYIIFHLDNHFVLLAHLRMEGKFYFKTKKEPISKHDLVIFHFTDDTYLTYNDTRRFGIMKILDENNYKNEEPLNKVGPDPFMLNSSDRLLQAFKNKSIPIKSALLDQSIMSGLGNIYVDEVLFSAKVHPLTPSKMVNKEKLDKILHYSKEILLSAISFGGSTIKSYHPDKGVSGGFQNNLKVYGHKDELCQCCHHHLKKIFVKGRGTTYCPHCQKNPNAPLVIGVTGAIGSGKSLVGEYFLKKGFVVIDADKIVASLYKEKEVIVHLKTIIKDLKIKNNEVDKDYLRDYLINNPSQKIKLEKYIHRLVELNIEKVINESTSNDKILLEVPLLFETHIDDFVDYSLFIDVNEISQIKHLKNRGINIDKMLKINKNFKKNIDKEKATFVIDNNSSIANLYKQLDVIYDKVMNH